MLHRLVKSNIIKRYCHHHTKTDFERMIIKINNIEKYNNFIDNKLIDIEKILVYNYIFNVFTFIIVIIK